MGVKTKVARSFIFYMPFFRNSNFTKSGKVFSSTQKKIEELKKRIVTYYAKESDNFSQTRKNHENPIRHVFKELKQNETTINNLLVCSEDAVYINKTVDELKEYVKSKRKKEKDVENVKKDINETKEKTEIVRVLATCGIRIEPNILFYFMYDILLHIKNYYERHKNGIHIYDEIKEKDEYVKINSYYYHSDIYPCFMSLFRSLSNVLYTICENCLDTTKIYFEINKELASTNQSIDDVIRKNPGFLNISILFFYINMWLFTDKSRKAKNNCLDHLNSFLGSISADEMNISSDDLFYLFLTFRLFFYAFSYNEVMSSLNNFSKQFLSSVVFFPHNSEPFRKNELIDYAYIVEFLNKNKKCIEHKEVYMLPFSFSLVSLKNKMLYVVENKDDYYINAKEVKRAYTWWRYLIAQHEGYKLLLLCKESEFSELLLKEKREALMTKYVSKDCPYHLN